MATVTILKTPLELTSFGSVNGSIDASSEAFSRFGGLSPPGCYHGYIVAFGRTWEYLGKGNSTGLSEPAYYAPRANETVVLTAVTNKTRREFKLWYDSQRSVFCAADYNLRFWNCLVFVEHACAFLEVQFPPQMEELLNWLQEHNPEEIAQGIQRVAGFGMVAVGTVAATRALVPAVFTTVIPRALLVNGLVAAVVGPTLGLPMAAATVPLMVAGILSQLCKFNALQ